MSFPVLICDDSPLARKQMARSLSSLNADITFAVHGLDAMGILKSKNLSSCFGSHDAGVRRLRDIRSNG